VYVCKYVELACYVAEEFRKTHLTPSWDLSYDDRLKPANIPTDAPADTFDWRDHGVVTPVKNQVWVYYYEQLLFLVYLCACDLVAIYDTVDTT